MANVTIKLDNIKAAIFDMDGTMINNMAYHKKAWAEFFKRHELSFTDDEFRQKISGKKNDQIFNLVFDRELTQEEIQEYTEEKEAIYREIYKPEIKEISGLLETIKTLKQKGLRLAIATTAPEKNRQFALDVLGLEEQFEIILGDEHVTRGKPDPEIYIEVAKQLQIDPSNCLVFEDSPPGVEAGKNAGMTVVGIMTTHTAEELNKADYHIQDYTQLEFI
jgi:beta-phosphoglucomutase